MDSPTSTNRQWLPTLSGLRASLTSANSLRTRSSISKSQVSLADTVDPHQSPRAANSSYGFRVLSPGSAPLEVDIVAVHGLNGHSDETWRHENGYSWLEESLPQDLEHGRVLTFGYDSQVFTKSILDIDDAARSLLVGLNTQRSDDGQGRPIVFICHSLGGIIVKQALVLAHEKLPVDTYSDILNSTKGLAFLGVPHKGSDMGFWANSAAEGLSYVTWSAVSTNTNFTECLRRNSPAFVKISSSFLQRSTSMVIKSFYETRKTAWKKISAVIVDKDSATTGLPNEELISVNADHISICKVPRPTSLEYDEVVRPIRNLVGTVLMNRTPLVLEQNRQNNIQEEELQRDILRLIFLFNPLSAMQRVQEHVRGTCAWILEHSQYIMWQDQGGSLLWLNAPPGYGKTVLARFLAEHHLKRRNVPSNGVTVCHFFCDSMIENQTTNIAMLRTILHQMFEQNRTLMKHAYSAYDSQGMKMAEDLGTLRTIFESCLEDPDLGRAVIIVDALDESEDYGRSLVEWMRAVLDKQASRKSSLQVILTSRPETFLSDYIAPSAICLPLNQEHSNIDEDVKRFIDAKIPDLPKIKKLSDDDQRWTTNFLKENSGETFLWVALVIDELANSTSLSRGSIQAMFNSLPHNLDGMYGKIFDKVRPGDRKKSKLLMQMIMAAHTPLSVSELNWLSAAKASHGQDSQVSDFLEADFDVTIRNLCGYLVRIIKDKVYLQHKTVRDFILQKTEFDENCPWYHSTEMEIKVEMVRCCVCRLKLAKHLVESLPSKDDTQVLASFKLPVSLSRFRSFEISFVREPFFKYAITHWTDHFREIQNEVEEDLLTEVREIYSDENVFKVWRDGYWANIVNKTLQGLVEIMDMMFTPAMSVSPKRESELVNKLNALQFPGSNSAACKIRMASYLGHIRIFNTLLDVDPSLCESVSSDGWTPLCTAVDMEQLDMVQRILNQQVDLEMMAQEKRPLHFAANKSDPKFVRILLEKGATIDSKARSGGTPLQSAAWSGHVRVVEALLLGKANVDLADNDGNTALHKAASRGHDLVVKRLLQGHAAINPHNKQAATPLFLAVQKGFDSVVGIFLEFLHQGLITRDEIQGRQHPILHAGIRSGNSVLIQMLLDAGIDALIEDEHGLKAFSYVPGKCDISVVKGLLERKAYIDEQDSTGRTLLHKTAAADNLDMLQFLLDRGADIRKTTHEGDTVLHCAVAGDGHMEVFQVLLEHGADIEAQNKAGYTPFHMAVLSWRSQTTIRILLELKASIETKNSHGETPLQTAVRSQNAGLVTYLLLRGARVDVRSTENYSILELAEDSFLLKLNLYRKRGTHDRSYRLECLSEDDNLFQASSGTVQTVALQKIDAIKSSLAEFGAKEDQKPDKSPPAPEASSTVSSSQTIAPTPETQSILERLPHSVIYSSRLRRSSLSYLEVLSAAENREKWNREGILDTPRTREDLRLVELKGSGNFTPPRVQSSTLLNLPKRSPSSTDPSSTDSPSPASVVPSSIETSGTDIVHS